MPQKQKPNFILLAVLDGWGMAPKGPGNAITLAETQNFDRLFYSFPHTQLDATGEAVGLPRGEVGNTEVGHINIGAGKIVYQDLPRINMAISNGSLFENPALVKACQHALTNKSDLHLMGLIGAGGVHSNIEHLFSLLHLAKQQKVNRVFIHLFTDGRDSPPTSSKIYIGQVRDQINKEGIGQIASVMGRYWAMDRDLRWERTAKAYFALTRGEGNLVKTPEEAIEMSYSQGQTDEFVPPALIAGQDGKPVGLINDNDSVIFFNFRIDRPRQLTRAFVMQDLEDADWGFDPYQAKYEQTHINTRQKGTGGFARGPKLKNLYFAMMTEYGKTLVEAGATVAFPPEIVDMPLGRIISENNLRQLRVSESEKERFVTFYFNGQREKPFPGEDRLIIPSPKVKTYDLKPEMSAYEMTDALINKIKQNPGYSLIILNYANPDMVGHTGNIGAAVAACRAVDECVGKLYSFVDANGGLLMITGDHGNAEEMISKTGEVNTEHTPNSVPFIIAGPMFNGQAKSLPSGILGDIAPTILSLLGISKPSAMTGRDLLS